MAQGPQGGGAFQVLITQGLGWVSLGLRIDDLKAEAGRLVVLSMLRLGWLVCLRRFWSS